MEERGRALLISYWEGAGGSLENQSLERAQSSARTPKSFASNNAQELQTHN
jgi:hypothetical protein